MAKKKPFIRKYKTAKEAEKFLMDAGYSRGECTSTLFKYSKKDEEGEKNATVQRKGEKFVLEIVTTVIDKAPEKNDEEE